MRRPAAPPANMAPEQWRREPEDERTDLFACGVILFEMRCGRLPFAVSERGRSDLEDSRRSLCHRALRWLRARLPPRPSRGGPCPPRPPRVSGSRLPPGRPSPGDRLGGRDRSPLAHRWGRARPCLARGHDCVPHGGRAGHPISTRRRGTPARRGKPASGVSARARSPMKESEVRPDSASQGTPWSRRWHIEILNALVTRLRSQKEG